MRFDHTGGGAVVIRVSQAGIGRFGSGLYPATTISKAAKKAVTQKETAAG